MKTAIVTGGTSGIGLGVAMMLVNSGYYVYATYAHNAPEGNIDNYEAIKVDQSNREETYRFIGYIKDKCEHVDCIVCNAGATIRKSFTESTDSDWDTMMEIAVNSHHILIRELYSIIPHGSRILFTGSQMGITPHATVLSYGVTKAAVHAMAKNLVKEFEGTGTTVNTIAPGFVETVWHRNKPAEIRDSICNKTAIHRFATVDEVVAAFKFCIDNPFVNGSTIEVNGGYSYK